MKDTTRIREFVYNGGGFELANQQLLIKEDSSNLDIFWVLKEMGYSLSTDKYFTKELKEHFIIEDIEDVHKIDFGKILKTCVWLNECNRST